MLIIIFIFGNINITKSYEVSCKDLFQFVRFEVNIAVSMKMAVFWVVVPRSLADVYQCFRGACCRHHEDDCHDDGGSTHL
jgi:hypothetical protein